MEFEGRQFYPEEKKPFMERIQDIINAYYEDEVPGGITAEEDVERLSGRLSAFPACLNAYADKMLVESLIPVLREDDGELLLDKRRELCRQVVEKAKAAVIGIETYAAMTQTPHLFTKKETDDLSEEGILDIAASIVCGMYGQEKITATEYAERLKASGERLDLKLLSLDYGE